jgi:hypothetical protein
MSWVFGAVCSAIAGERHERFAAIHARPLQVLRSDMFYVACGGLTETCHYSDANTAADGWCVLGTGITLHGGRCSLLSRNDWQTILSAGEPDLSRVDGHFSIVRWVSGAVDVFIDEIGIRTLYIAPIEGGYCFSSRLHWLAQAMGTVEISFDELGAHWLLTNKLAYGSFLKNVVRLGPGGRAKIVPNMLEATSTPWLPVIAETTDNSLVQTLTAFVQPELSQNKRLSLGLSGGFDSRVLLALLASASDRRFALHSFGGTENPDVAIPKRIASELSLPHDQFDEPLPSVDETISLVKEYVAQTNLITPVSAVLKLRYYERMHQRGCILIDGGFGEISRRQMGNSLLRKGASALREGNPEILFSLMRQFRADIFRPEIVVEMRRQALLEIESVWRAMPSVSDIGVENFVDLLSLRARVANNSPAPQDWIDSRIVNFMPYVQPSFLREVFHVPLRERRNARMYRRVIHSRCPILTSFPLEKSGATYPYSFGTISSWIWRMMKTKLGRKYDEPYNHQLLLHIKEFVLDVAHSSAIYAFDAYDRPKVVHLVDTFYSGKRELASQVDWWLTFELWRRAVNIK